MIVELKGPARARLARDLRRHRDEHTESDIAYATEILGVSLNTYKKCIDVDGTKVLVLKRQSFVTILSRSGLKPSHYGLAIAIAGPASPYGGYTREEFEFLPGRYFLHRRSFLTGLNINRSLLEIAWSREKACYTFRERLRYRSDRGVLQETEYRGNIYMHADRILMSLLCIADGEVRVVMLHTPSRRKGTSPLQSSTRVFGVLIAHGYPRSFFQPVVSSVQVESVPAGAGLDLERLSGTLKPTDADYDRLMADLRHAEEHSVIFTPLLARQAAPIRTS